MLVFGWTHQFRIDVTVNYLHVIQALYSWMIGKEWVINTKGHRRTDCDLIYEGWNFNSGNYLFTTDTK